MTEFSKYDSNIYKFLSLNNDWITKADKNADSIIICSEFTSYLGEKMDTNDWNGESLSSTEEKDILGSFFSRILDTDKSSGSIKGHKNISKEAALDSTEQISMNNKIKKYGEILEKIQGNCPGYIKNKDAWINGVIEQIFNTYGSNFDINNIGLDYIYTTVTAKMLSEQCFKDMATIELNGLNYDMKGDSILQSLLDSYIKTKQNEKFNAISLKSDVEKLIIEYLNYAAIPCTSLSSSSSLNIENLKDNKGNAILTDKTFTHLQRAVTINKISTAMIARDSKYATNSNLLNEAIDNFITACVKDGTIIPTGNWGNKNIDWNSIINEFANSIYKIDLDNKLSGGDKKEQLRAIWPENPFDSALEEGGKNYTFNYAAQFTEELESDVKIEYAIDVITGADLGVQVSVIDSKTGKFNLITGDKPGNVSLNITVTVGEVKFTKTLDITIEDKVDEEKQNAGNRLYQAYGGFLTDSEADESGQDDYWGVRYLDGTYSVGLLAQDIDNFVVSSISEDLRKYVDGVAEYCEVELGQSDIYEYAIENKNYAEEIKNIISDVANSYYGKCDAGKTYQGVTIYKGYNNYSETRYQYLIDYYTPRRLFAEEIKKRFCG